MKTKTSLLIIAFTLFSFANFSQSKKYKEWMKKNITLLDSAKTDVQLLAAALGFEKIAALDKKEWLPNYYAGLAYVHLAYKKEGLPRSHES